MPDDTINLGTGLDSAGHVVTAGNQLDANWKVTHATKPKHEGSGYSVFPGNADWYPGWLVNGPRSAWIAGNPDDANGNGKLVATRTFTLAANQAAAGTFSGTAATLDDSGTVLLNGKQIASIGDSNWGALQPITVPPGSLVPGVNTLEIRIDASDTYLEAVRFEGTLTVPPPPPWFATPLGILCILLTLIVLVVIVRFARRRPAPEAENPASGQT